MPDCIQVLYLGIIVLNQKVRGFVFKKSFQQSEVQYRKEMGKMEKQVHKHGAFSLYWIHNFEKLVYDISLHNSHNDSNVNM